VSGLRRAAVAARFWRGESPLWTRYCVTLVHGEPVEGFFAGGLDEIVFHEFPSGLKMMALPGGQMFSIGRATVLNVFGRKFWGDS
jgi:hypothetical protein